MKKADQTFLFQQKVSLLNSSVQFKLCFFQGHMLIPMENECVSHEKINKFFSCQRNISEQIF